MTSHFAADLAKNIHLRTAVFSDLSLIPDEKLKFYKMCTREFTEEHFQRIKEIYKCLLKKLKP
jgi:hypothetical protein